MTLKKNEDVITLDGEYSFEAWQQGKEVQLEWCISAGTATITPGYVDLDGNFAPSRGLDGVLPAFGAEGGICTVRLPNSGKAALKVENASILDVEDETVALSMKICHTRLNA